MSFPYHPRSVKTPWSRDESAGSNKDTDISRADRDRHESVRSNTATGSGTEVSGYVESPVEKRCGTCEYIKDHKFCRQETVLKDSEIPDGSNGLKIVDPKDGCCSFWEAGENGEQRYTSGTVDKPRAGANSLKPTLGKAKGSEEGSSKLRLTFY